MSIRKYTGVSNESFRMEWTRRQIQECLSSPFESIEVLDVGAGTSPFKEHISNLGAKYYSHDFNSYFPSNSSPGIQNQSWDYAQHDYVCDILDIPENRKFDLIICTEVLEHVPDPRAAFAKLVKLVSPGGTMIVTVPFMSLMHQAPFWYSSGLSPYWILDVAKSAKLTTLELAVSGDYIDLLDQEIYRLVSQVNFFGVRRLARAAHIVQKLRKHIPNSLLECGGFGTLFVGKMP